MKILLLVGDTIDDYYQPLEKAELVRSGKDVTIMCYSRMRYVVMQAVQQLESQGYDPEVGLLCLLLWSQNIENPTRPTYILLRIIGLQSCDYHPNLRRPGAHAAAQCMTRWGSLCFATEYRVLPHKGNMSQFSYSVLLPWSDLTQACLD